MRYRTCQMCLDEVPADQMFDDEGCRRCARTERVDSPTVVDVGDGDGWVDGTVQVPGDEHLWTASRVAKRAPDGAATYYRDRGEWALATAAEARTFAPRPPTRVLDEDAVSWLVECAAATCVRGVRVPRTVRPGGGEPLRFDAPDDAQAAGYGASRCVLHPPTTRR